MNKAATEKQVNVLERDNFSLEELRERFGQGLESYYDLTRVQASEVIGEILERWAREKQERELRGWPRKGY